MTSPSFLSELWSVPSVSGETVTPISAQRVGAVYACVRRHSDSVGSIPLSLLQNLDPRGTKPATGHALYSLLKDSPNPEMTSMDFRSFQQRCLELRGNAYAEIVRSGNGRIAEIWPLHPDRMSVYRDLKSGELRYLYVGREGAVAFLPSDIWHLKGPSNDGVLGLSPIQEASEVFAGAQAMQKYGNEFFANGSAPLGTLATDKRVEEDVAKRVRKGWEEAHKGGGKRHRIAILELGMKYEAVSIKPEDIQFLESISASRGDIAGIFGIPPHLIGDTEKTTSWGKGIEQQFIGWIQVGLIPRIVAWEQSIAKDLLMPGERGTYRAKFNVAGLQRGDFTSRMQGYSMGRQWGWWSVNDIRELEDQNPIDGGDVYLQPTNMQPATVTIGPAPAAVPDSQGDNPTES